LVPYYTDSLETLETRIKFVTQQHHRQQQQQQQYSYQQLTEVISIQN